MLNFCDFIQVFVFTPNHHLKSAGMQKATFGKPCCKNLCNIFNLMKTPESMSFKLVAESYFGIHLSFCTFTIFHFGYIIILKIFLLFQ